VFSVFITLSWLHQYLRVRGTSAPHFVSLLPCFSHPTTKQLLHREPLFFPLFPRRHKEPPPPSFFSHSCRGAAAKFRSLATSPDGFFPFSDYMIKSLSWRSPFSLSSFCGTTGSFDLRSVRVGMDGVHLSLFSGSALNPMFLLSSPPFPPTFSPVQTGSG